MLPTTQELVLDELQRAVEAIGRHDERALESALTAMRVFVKDLKVNPRFKACTEDDHVQLEPDALCAATMHFLQCLFNANGQRNGSSENR